MSIVQSLVIVMNAVTADAGVAAVGDRADRLLLEARAAHQVGVALVYEHKCEGVDRIMEARDGYASAVESYSLASRQISTAGRPGWESAAVDYAIGAADSFVGEMTASRLLNGVCPGSMDEFRRVEITPLFARLEHDPENAYRLTAMVSELRMILDGICSRPAVAPAERRCRGASGHEVGPKSEAPSGPSEWLGERECGRRGRLCRRRQVPMAEGGRYLGGGLIMYYGIVPAISARYGVTRDRGHSSIWGGARVTVVPYDYTGFFADGPVFLASAHLRGNLRPLVPYRHIAIEADLGGGIAVDTKDPGARGLLTGGIRIGRFREFVPGGGAKRAGGVGRIYSIGWLVGVHGATNSSLPVVFDLALEVARIDVRERRGRARARRSR